MATGDPLILGKTNEADANTYLIRKNPRGRPGGNTLWVQAVDGAAAAILAQSVGPLSGPGMIVTSGNVSPALRAISGGSGGTAVWGEAVNGIGIFGEGGEFGYAGIFLGNVRVHGDFDVTGVKSAAVEAPDGSLRRLYCLESPESWFEDFGEARLVRGRARVRIDPAFARLVRGPYHLFLTPHGESNGLFVARRTRQSFAVREQGGGASSVTFSYRIVARRRDVDAPRLARVKRSPKLKRQPRVKLGARGSR
jgi:hypothetical protein